MPCMCGDYCCPSCGPAQGNWRCPICREWASELCEHMHEGVCEEHQRFPNTCDCMVAITLKPEFEALAEEMARQEAEAEAAAAQAAEEAQERYWSEQE